MTTLVPESPGWADVLEDHAGRVDDRTPARRPARRVRGGRARVLPPARALGARRRVPVDAGGREAALRHAADRARRRSRARPPARPLPARARADRPRALWYGGPGAASCWSGRRSCSGPASARARRASRRPTSSSPCSSRALQGLADMARSRRRPDRSSLWAGCSTCARTSSAQRSDLRALAASFELRPTLRRAFYDDVRARGTRRAGDRALARRHPAAEPLRSASDLPRTLKRHVSCLARWEGARDRGARSRHARGRSTSSPASLGIPRRDPSYGGHCGTREQRLISARVVVRLGTA
jgi:hypothetical protein